jgi:hypothetical protein
MYNIIHRHFSLYDVELYILIFFPINIVCLLIQEGYVNCVRSRLSFEGNLLT